MELILIRHTTARGDDQKKYLGSTDFSLNRKGYKQAEHISYYLKNKNISAIYSSNLKRACETATLIAKPHRIKIQKEGGLNEFHFGCWEGKTFSEIQKKYPTLAREYLTNPLGTKISGGESFGKFKNRVKKALGKILNRREGTIVIVSHGGVNRMIICSLLNLPLDYFWQIKQDIGAINIIEIYHHSKIISLLNGVLWEN